MSQQLARLELLETLVDHLRIGVVLVGPEGDVELQTPQVNRFERLLGVHGVEWIRPLLELPCGGARHGGNGEVSTEGPCERKNHRAVEVDASHACWGDVTQHIAERRDHRLQD